jgi:hypothetical protein
MSNISKKSQWRHQKENEGSICINVSETVRNVYILGPEVVYNIEWCDRFGISKVFNLTIISKEYTIMKVIEKTKDCSKLE